MATKPKKIQDDIRVVKFPDILILEDVFLDFEIRLEVYITCNKDVIRKGFRKASLRRVGTLTLTVDDINKKRFRLTELVAAASNPIKTKILMHVENTIIANVQFEGILFVFYQNVWQKSLCSLNGHLLKVFLSCNKNTKRNVSPIKL